MQLNIVERKKVRTITSSNVMWLSVLLLFTLLGSLYFGVIQPNSIYFILLIMAALTPLATNIYGNYEYFPKDFDIVSKIDLNNDSIAIGDQQLELQQIKTIDIIVNDWLGKKVVHNIFPYSAGPKLSMGINNSISITLIESELIKLNFQLESKDQFIELGCWIKSLYKSHITIKEKYDNSRSYGLKHLTYNEIQRFKEKYST